MTDSFTKYRQVSALVIAAAATGGPLLGMTLVTLLAPAYLHLLQAITPALLTLALILIGAPSVGLALLPSFFFGALSGYLLNGPWPYLASISGLALATAIGLALGRLFSTNFLEVLLQRKADWWDTYNRLIHASGAFLPIAVALLRLSPHMPFALTNLVCARLPLGAFKTWFYSYLGLLPRTLLAAYIGSQLQDWRTLFDRERPPWELLLSLALFAGFIYFARRTARRFETA